MASCYFCYSWETDFSNEECTNILLSGLKKKIECHSNHNVEVIYDKESFGCGDNFREKEKLIKDSDCVLVFFSSSFKKKLDEGGDNGICREYDMLRQRLLTDYKGVVPILLSGSKETAVPEEFKDHIYWDLSRYKEQLNKSNSTRPLGDKLDASLDRIAEKAVKEACSIAYCKEITYASIEEEYKALFLNCSADYPLPSKCIVKTAAQDYIMAQRGYIVIGRKGSGKTTLIQAIKSLDPKEFDEKYKTEEFLSADFFDINFIFNNLVDKNRKEFNVLSLSKILDTFWEILFFLQSVVTIGKEIERYRIDSTDPRYVYFSKVAERLKELLGISEGTFSQDYSKISLCHCAAEILSNHIKKEILDKASGETPLTGAISSLDSFVILRKLFGKELFSKYFAGIKACKKRILLALDGFNTHVEDFRTVTSNYYKTNKKEYDFRNSFENLLFRELLFTVHELKNSSSLGQKQCFFSVFDFCVILPQDRWDSISHIDRDIVKRDYCNLNWDAYELLNMLVKRLEYHYRVEEKDYRSKTLEERFNYIIKAYMPNIPTEIKIDIDNHSQRISLYNYLLRFTFWRPRDIIKNFAIIMMLSKDDEPMSTEITQSIIKKYINKSASNIIEEEFIGEYKNTYLNLKEILQGFRSGDFKQDYDVFSRTLSKIPFLTSLPKAVDQVHQKIEILYKLGIIGLCFSKTYTDKKGYGHCLCYSFNEGLEPMENYISQEVKEDRAKIVFNPIFVSYLSLNYNDNDVVGDFSWEYINTNHALKNLIKRP